MPITTSDRVVAHFRLPVPLVKEIDHMAVDFEMTRAGMIQALLELALNLHRRGLTRRVEHPR